MYLNSNKSDTNIDKEFSQEKNTANNIMNIFNQYKKIILIALGVIIVIIVIIVIASNKKTDYLILNGDETITIYQGSDYIEAGFNAYNSKKQDLTDNVVIKSTLNTDKIGEYEITYTINNITKTRIINVIKKPAEYTYIYLNTVNNDVNVYLKVGQTYTEPGYAVYNNSGKNLNRKVKVTGNVDTSKKGNYKLIYSVVDSDNVTISATRTVVVE